MRLDAVVLSAPDSIAWLLNIRGADIPRNPIVQGFAVLHADATVDVFLNPSKLDAVRDHLGTDVRNHAPEAFLDTLAGLEGPVLIDKSSVPVRVADVLGEGARWGEDPCALPKACKKTAEIATYPSLTEWRGQRMLWYPDRKHVLLGKRIPDELLDAMKVD